MSKLSLSVTMELHFLRDFLDHLERDAARDWNELEARAENGEFEDIGDYESAMDYPLFRAEFGARAVYYELSALLESQLQALAEPAWRRLNSNPPVDPLKRKIVHDLPIGRIRELVKNEYRIDFTEVDGWHQVARLREIVNAYKHRGGMKRFKDISKNPETGGYDFRYDTSLTEAQVFLEIVPEFLENLLAAVGATSANV